MATKTLFSIVDSIQVSRIRLSCYPLAEVSNSPWTQDEQKLFLKLIIEYGTDLALIHRFFPNRTRSQIKRKYRDISEIRRKVLIRQEQKRIRQNRKSYFDQEILEQKLMKWPSKPNNSGSSTSDIQI